MQVSIFLATWICACKRLKKGEFKPKLRQKCFHFLQRFLPCPELRPWPRCKLFLGKSLDLLLLGIVGGYICTERKSRRLGLNLFQLLSLKRESWTPLGSQCREQITKVLDLQKHGILSWGAALSFKIENKPMTHLEGAMSFQMELRRFLLVPCWPGQGLLEKKSCLIWLGLQAEISGFTTHTDGTSGFQWHLGGGRRMTLKL